MRLFPRVASLIGVAALGVASASPELRADSQNPAASIPGVVRHARGQPVQGASVVLMQFIGSDRQFARMSDAANDEGLVRVETDREVAYRLSGLPRGEYIVRATTMSHAPGAAPVV